MRGFSEPVSSGTNRIVSLCALPDSPTAASLRTDRGTDRGLPERAMNRPTQSKRAISGCAVRRRRWTR